MPEVAEPTSAPAKLSANSNAVGLAPSFFVPHDLFTEAQTLDSRQLEQINRWETFPLQGRLELKALDPPREEPERQGAGAIDCPVCSEHPADLLWSGKRWKISQWESPRAFPSVFVTPVLHFELSTMSLDTLAEVGIVLKRASAALERLDGVERAHIEARCDGGEHMHWMLMGRPSNALQIRGTFLPLWDMLLPPMPPALWRAVGVEVGRNIDLEGGLF